MSLCLTLNPTEACPKLSDTRKILKNSLNSVVKNLPAMQTFGFDSGVRKIPRKRRWQPVPVFLPGKSHGQRSLTGYSPQSPKESNMA